MEKNKKDNTIKIKKDKREIFTRIMAGFLALAMILATCSTFIYYIMINVK